MEDDPTYYVEHEDAIETEHGARKANFIDRSAAAADAVNELLAIYLPLGVDFTISCVSCTFRLRGLTVHVSHGAQGIVAIASSDVLPRRRLDPLRNELRNIVATAVDEIVLDAWAFACLLLRLAEEATWHLQEFLEAQLLSQKKASPRSGWDATSVQDWSSILDNPYGVNLLTVNDTAKFLLGQSISEICADIDQQFMRVLHVEPVFRHDLVTRFLQRRRKMKEDLMQLSHSQLRECVTKRQVRSRELENSVDGLAEYLSTPHVTFHGAPRSVISSIVRYGFVKPGEEIGKTGTHLDVRCGASFGLGVYSSPSIEFASGYTMYGDGGRAGFRNPSDVPGLRMIVCATLMGRAFQVTRDQTRRTSGLCRSDIDSHVSPDRLEYIVFDTAQIIPCYVLHLDYGADSAREHFDCLAAEPTLFLRSSHKPRVVVDAEEDCPGARQARKDALKAAAAKWFPYGYGPAKGTNFVIEEIGEISDDEEEYGEFQEMRADAKEEFLYQRPSDEKASWFDEYQNVRHSKSEIKARTD